MDFGIDTPRHAQTGKSDARSPSAFYHAHWYTNPLMFWLEVLLDDSCLEQGVFDVAYITEIDPLWSDSMTTFIINPDVALWGNPIAQAACALDCVAATAFGFGRDELLWCAGCQGSMFPLNGWVSSKVGGVQASSLITARMTSKLHREMLMWAASGQDGTCGYAGDKAALKCAGLVHQRFRAKSDPRLAGADGVVFDAESAVFTDVDGWFNQHRKLHMDGWAIKFGEPSPEAMRARLAKPASASASKES